MGHALRKFVPRAPRYVLRPQDHQFLRFAHRDERNHSFATELLNVSITGIAFLVDRDAAPMVGELIKVEFPVPGGDQIAWWARVVRAEEPRHRHWWAPERKNHINGDRLIIGIEFQNLPEGHVRAIRTGLDKKFREILRERKKLVFMRILQFLADHFWQLFIYVTSVLLAAAILYQLSRPTENYDAERGSPWGERFKFFQNQ